MRSRPGRGGRMDLNRRRNRAGDMHSPASGMSRGGGEHGVRVVVTVYRCWHARMDVDQSGLAGRQPEVLGRDRDVTRSGVGEAAGIDIGDTVADDDRLATAITDTERAIRTGGQDDLGGHCYRDRRHWHWSWAPFSWPMPSRL